MLVGVLQPPGAAGLAWLSVAFFGVYMLARLATLGWRVRGAAWMTALLGGAIATHLHVDSPLFSHTLFGVYLGLIMWGGLWLRDASLRAVFPIRRTA